MKKGVLFAVAAVVAAVASARTEDVTLWRGETRCFILRDFAKVGVAPAGIEVKIGTAKEIRYLDRPLGTHYLTMADRVVWGGDEPGVKVASVTVAPDVAAGTYEAGDLRVTVVDRVLPPAKDWKYQFNLWQHPWSVAYYHGDKPFSEAHYRHMEPLYRELAAAGQKSIDTSITDLPWGEGYAYDRGEIRTMVKSFRRADGTWRYDYTDFDAFVEALTAARRRSASRRTPASRSTWASCRNSPATSFQRPLNRPCKVLSAGLTATRMKNI